MLEENVLLNLGSRHYSLLSVGIVTVTRVENNMRTFLLKQGKGLVK